MSYNPPLLELTDVYKHYEFPGSAAPAEVLRGLSLRVRLGESLAVVGPSGSGKSTLLNIIGTLDKPTSGQVMLDGQDLRQKDEKSLATIRSRQIGFVFQLHHLLPQCTVLENVLIPTLAWHGRPSRENNRGAADRAQRLLERVGLTGRVSYRPGQLSGGERQRVAVVRALINAPKLLLADEPTGSLDQEASNNLADLLVELNRAEGATLIVVTHSPDLARRMNRMLELSDGVLVEKNSRK
ncbi:MAG: ABC transporter ATP-binding protein [Phycisphaerae bacterium]|nr:ABC transporter ATP-binding protein [Phycisphaerae bacterium]